MEEGTTLYRGWGWTMARNAPGSFAVRTSSLIETPLLSFFLFIPFFFWVSLNSFLVLQR